MNLKNLLLTLGICCTTVGSALSITPKITTPVKAETNLEYEFDTEVTSKRVDNGNGQQAWMYRTATIGSPIKVKAYTFYVQNINLFVNQVHITTVFEVETKDQQLTNGYINSYLKLKGAYDLTRTAQVSEDFLQQYIDGFNDNDITLLDSDRVTDYFEQVWDVSDTGQTELEQQARNTKKYYTCTRIENTNLEYDEYTDEPRSIYEQNYLGFSGGYYDGIYVPPGTNTGKYEAIDLPGLMLEILSMPFTFISTAFNLTLFPGTQYQVNIGNFILGIIAILTVLFIIKIFTGGLDIIGNITNSARNNSTERIRLNTAKQKSKRQNQAAKNANKKTKKE